jgi:hypothetical protein
MILYHAATPKLAKLYRASGKINKPVRGLTTYVAACTWALKCGRTIINKIDCDKPYKLPDHHNKYGEAWWNDDDINIDKIKCVSRE